MFCRYCGSKIEDGYLFCPKCGEKNNLPSVETTDDEKTTILEQSPIKSAAEPVIPVGKAVSEPLHSDTTVTEQATEKDDAAAEAPKSTEASAPETDAVTAKAPVEAAKPIAAEPFKTQASSVESPAWQSTGYRQPSGYAQPISRPTPPPYQQAPYYGKAQPAVPSQQGYNPPAAPKPPKPKKEKSKRTYHKSSAGIKVLSVFLCILMFAFGSAGISIASVRIALQENNVRNICRSGRFTDLIEYTADGKKSLAAVLFDGVISTKDNKTVVLTDDQINRVLTNANADQFIEELVVNYQQYFLNGVTPYKLNASEIKSFMEKVNLSLKKETRCTLPQSYIDGIEDRVNNGDLSFLSIDSTGGGFKRHYGVDPKIFTYPVSIWAMIIYFVLALIFLALIFIINRKNPLTGLHFNGITLIILGAVYVLSALGGLIASISIKMYPLPALIRYLALGFSVTGVIALVIGILLLVIRGIMKKNAVIEP